MNFGKSQKKVFRSPNLLLKVYFIVGSGIIFLFFILYTNSLLQIFKEDAQVVPNLFARFFSFSTQENWESLMTQYIFEEIITEIEYPIILTDEAKRPLYWRNVGIREDVRYDVLDSEEKRVLERILNRMQRDRNIIPLRYQQDDMRVLNYAFYGESTAMRRLRYMPYIEALLVLIFVVFGIYAIYFFKRNEKDVLWIGMAKEMAHQLGTPISSLLGWLDVLNSRLTDIKVDEDTRQMIDYMSNDVRQLKKIAHRFGKIGSEIVLVPTDLHELLESSVQYYKERLPHFTNRIDILFLSKIENVKVKVDPDLIKWAVENLIKNAIDAMHGRDGNIIIIAFQEDGKTHISVQDEGKGIPKVMIGRIFDPGVSSKARGWGLGLSLSKRIIEEFHNGKIFIVRSVVGEGTVFEIVLPEG